MFSVQDAEQVLHFAEFGVVLSLFLIGLELRPRRLWAMRQAIFGLGTLRVAITGLALACVGIFFLGSEWQPSLFCRDGAGVVFDGIYTSGDGRERPSSRPGTAV
ncbi:cation:proton antiporter [Bradyrhizobium sp. RDI18]|uniref:cation:proton antiporter domain-containing protein n=1 Tax=Bradyrhizobium sp. RDI18 TaxID=3367400 RepID=UPI003719A636